MTPLTDNSTMMFGEYEGRKLADVPASYLLWIYKNFSHLREDLKAYIENNVHVLEKEINK